MVCVLSVSLSLGGYPPFNSESSSMSVRDQIISGHYCFIRSRWESVSTQGKHLHTLQNSLTHTYTLKHTNTLHGSVVLVLCFVVMSGWKVNLRSWGRLNVWAGFLSQDRSEIDCIRLSLVSDLAQPPEWPPYHDAAITMLHRRDGINHLMV